MEAGLDWNLDCFSGRSISFRSALNQSLYFLTCYSTELHQQSEDLVTGLACCRLLLDSLLETRNIKEAPLILIVVPRDLRRT